MNYIQTLILSLFVFTTVVHGDSQAHDNADKTSTDNRKTERGVETAAVPIRGGDVKAFLMMTKTLPSSKKVVVYINHVEPNAKKGQLVEISRRASPKFKTYGQRKPLRSPTERKISVEEHPERPEGHKEIKSIKERPGEIKLTFGAEKTTIPAEIKERVRIPDCLIL